MCTYAPRHRKTDRGGADERERKERRRGRINALPRNGCNQKKNSTACTSHNLQTTAGPNVSVLRTAWKLRGGAATRHDGRKEVGEERKRETERDRRGRKTRGKKETRYILYDSVIAFPRTNIAPAERTQENVDVNRRPLPLPLSLPIPPPRNRSFFTASGFLWEKTFVKRSPPFHAFGTPDPVNLPSLRS